MILHTLAKNLTMWLKYMNDTGHILKVLKQSSGFALIRINVNTWIHLAIHAKIARDAI